MKNYFLCVFVIITLLLLTAINVWAIQPNTTITTYIVGALIYYIGGFTLAWLIHTTIKESVNYKIKFKTGKFYYVVPFDKIGTLYTLAVNYDSPFDMMECEYISQAITQPEYPLMMVNKRPRIIPEDYIFDKKKLLLLRFGFINLKRSVNSNDTK